MDWRRAAPVLLAAVLVAAGARAQSLRSAAPDTITLYPDAPLHLSGPAQTVFDSRHDSCRARGLHDVPDGAAIAFRRADGRVVLMAGNSTNLAFEGESPDAVERVCRPLLPVARNPDPASYDNWQWIRALYSEDGRHVLALIHNEYHGWEQGGVCPTPGRGGRAHLQCWWASATWAWSDDGGMTFRQHPAPRNLLAALPQRYRPLNGRIGIASPTQIVRNPHDGRYYALVGVKAAVGSQSKGMCVLRGENLDPSTWRAWDGKGFAARFTDPYTQPERPGARVCATVTPLDLWSVVYSTHHGEFLALGQQRGDVVLLRSPDLLHWSRPERVAPFVRHSQWRPGDPAPTSYYAFLDTDSPARNFDTVDARTWLYFVRWPVRDGRIDNGVRELVRVPVGFGADAQRNGAPQRRSPEGK